MTTKTKAFETKDALDLYKKIIYTEGKAGRRMDKKQIEEIIDLAIKQLGYSYAPYSHFHVGAALLAKNGTYYTGCNIENAAYGSTMCAERNAVFGAYCKGYRKEDIIGLAIVADCSPIASPCGACRQVLSELVDLEMPIFLANKEKVEKHTIGELLPMVFIGESL